MACCGLYVRGGEPTCGWMPSAQGVVVLALMHWCVGLCCRLEVCCVAFRVLARRFRTIAFHCSSRLARSCSRGLRACFHLAMPHPIRLLCRVLRRICACFALGCGPLPWSLSPAPEAAPPGLGARWGGCPVHSSLSAACGGERGARRNLFILRQSPQARRPVSRLSLAGDAHSGTSSSRTPPSWRRHLCEALRSCVDVLLFLVGSWSACPLLRARERC